MPLKKPIKAGADYVVRFSSHVTSEGSTLVSVGWVPKSGHAVPDPETILVAAGGAAQVSGKVPKFADARLMEVIMDLPDTGFGTVEVLEDGDAHSAGPINADTTWKMLVE